MCVSRTRMCGCVLVGVLSLCLCGFLSKTRTRAHRVGSRTKLGRFSDPYVYLTIVWRRARKARAIAPRGVIIINAFAFSFGLSVGQPVSCTILINNHDLWTLDYDMHLLFVTSSIYHIHLFILNPTSIIKINKTRSINLILN